MAVGSGIYITWITGAILLSIAMMPLFKPSYAKINAEGFVDMFRRYWAHMFVVFSVYLWKDLLDGLDRVLMANTQLDMTPYVYAVEGDIVLWIQEAFRSPLLDFTMTHFYVMGFMTATFASFLYPIYFDDRHMADRVSLSMFWVYVLAIPFFLFFNVRVTGDHIPAMETIAYDLTPEIHNWFTRIDPFTNGMPSLHIGLPLAIWLTMGRWDEDGRWNKYRTILFAFISLTAFSIIYLGIHWFADIIGGMMVAILAVEVTDRTHSSIWKVADERIFTRRLARLLDDPSGFLRKATSEIRDFIRPFKEPSKKQTSLFIALLLSSTGTVLLWDATHQDFPVEGVEWPKSAGGSDGWLVGVEVDPVLDGIDDVEVTAWNVSDEESYKLVGDPWSEPPSVEVSGSFLVLSNEHRIDFYNLESSEQDPFSPIFSRTEQLSILSCDIGEDEVGSPLVVMLTNNSVFTLDMGQVITEFSEIERLSDIVEVSGNLIAWSMSNSTTPTIAISSFSNPLSTSTISLNVQADEADDQFLSDSSDTPVVYDGASVVEIAMDSKSIVAVVDVGPVNRTVFVDIATGEQIMLSTPIWESSSPSVDHGFVAFLQIPRFDPSGGPGEGTEPNQVYLYEISANQTRQISFDEEKTHSSPHILLGGIGWIVTDSEGSSELNWHDLEETFEPYSSVLLQVSTVLLIPLLFIWASQNQSEKREE